MAFYSDPDQDKTNPEPRYIHQKFDDEAENYGIEPYDAFAITEDVTDDESYDRARAGLYNPGIGANTFEDILEDSREEPFFDNLDRPISGYYPDEFERLQAEEEEENDDPSLSSQEFDVENYFGTSFDPEGQEGDPVETRPADEGPELPTERG